MSVRKTAMILFRILCNWLPGHGPGRALVPGYPFGWAWAFLPLLLSFVSGWP